MADKNTAITVENLSKCYRIGLKEEVHDSLSGALLNFFTAPLKNYRKYRSLYRFDDIKGARTASADVIWALRDVSFEVRQGEALGIIGRNGAGKSTLLKILSRITDPTGGSARIHGKVSSLLEVGTGFHPELTGRENAYLNGTILGMKKKEVDRKFDQIVAFAGIEKFIDTPVKRYSSGMKVRLAFSVAAHLEPDILVVDEVLAVGDADFQHKCLNKMKEVGSSGRTVLFVSHNLPAVTRLCGRAILIDEGKIINEGPASSVVRGYLQSDQSTAAFREWPDPEKAPGGRVVRLRAVRVRDEEGKTAETVDIRRRFGIDLEYEILKPGNVLLPRIGLWNENGDLIFVSFDQDPEWRCKPRPKGVCLSTVWIPGNLLAEGMHYVSCVLSTIKPEVNQFWEKSVVAFQVVDTIEGDSARGEVTKKIPGIIRPLLEWDTHIAEGANYEYPRSFHHIQPTGYD